MPAPSEGSRFPRLKKIVRDATGINGFQEGREIERSCGHGKGDQLATGVLYGATQVALPLLYRGLSEKQGENSNGSWLKVAATVLPEYGMLGAFVGTLYLLGPVEAVGVRLAYGASVSALPEVKKSISARLRSSGSSPR